MELGTFERQLRLISLLTQNRLYSLREIERRLNISVRTIYRYIELFRDMGFIIEREGQCFRIDKSSPFLRDISDRVHFTDEEAATLRKILDGVSHTHIEARLLRNKLCRIYDFGIVTDTDGCDERLSANLNALYDAIKERRVAILRKYKSANSRTVSDRAVEPFQLLNGGAEVRCYEIMTGQCKTFKLSRIERVEIVELLWGNERKHETLHVDAFGFSSSDQQYVTLRMGELACDLLREEYPKAATYLHDDMLRIPVSSFLGIGRFVMGLPEEIEVIENDAFKAFLREKLSCLQSQL